MSDEPRGPADGAEHDGAEHDGAEHDRDGTEATDDVAEAAERQPTVLDVLVFGPVDAAFALLRDPKGSATRGRARVDEALRQARAIGELSVQFGSRELRRRAESAAAERAASAPATVTAPPPPDAGPSPDDVIADYDALSASQIVPMLGGLDAEERARVAAYEARARGRQTILRKIAQLDGTGD